MEIFISFKLPKPIIMNHLKRLLLSSILLILLSLISCQEGGYCVCYIYENGVQTRIDESESGNCQSESYFIDEDNYSVCQVGADGDEGF